METDQTDTQLVEAARGGNRQALGQILQRHQGQVLRFGKKMCGGEADAEDILQETLLAAARTLPQFRGEASVSTWLYTIARSFCIKQRRRSLFAPAVVELLDRGEPGRAARELPDQARTPEQALEGRRFEVALEEAIAALEPMYREVLLLRCVEGFSTAEAARALQISVEAVKSRLHRARLQIRARVVPTLRGDLLAEQPRSEGRGGVGVVSRRAQGESGARPGPRARRALSLAAPAGGVAATA